MPVAVVVTGARQTGKSTLVRDSSPRPAQPLPDAGRYRRHSMPLADEPELLLVDVTAAGHDRRSAATSPISCARSSAAIDRAPPNRAASCSPARPTCCSCRRVSESLAGRASYLTLWPMTRARAARSRARLRTLGASLLTTDEREWIALLRSQPCEAADWRALARRGGFPVPALQLERDQDRAIWFDGYVRTYLERDLQDIAQHLGTARFPPGDAPPPACGLARF